MRKAKSRLLWPQISVSPRVNSLSLKACLLYTWLIAHADDQGRMSADPKAVKGAVCPMRDDITVDEIPKLLGEMESQGLILRYATEIKAGVSFRKVMALQIMDWPDYQILWQPRASQYPPMEGWQDLKGKERARDEGGRYKPGATNG